MSADLVVLDDKGNEMAPLAAVLPNDTAEIESVQPNSIGTEILLQKSTKTNKPSQKKGSERITKLQERYERLQVDPVFSTYDYICISILLIFIFSALYYRIFFFDRGRNYKGDLGIRQCTWLKTHALNDFDIQFNNMNPFTEDVRISVCPIHRGFTHPMRRYGFLHTPVFDDGIGHRLKKEFPNPKPHYNGPLANKRILEILTEDERHMVLGYTELVRRAKRSFISDILNCEVARIVCPINRWFVRYKTDTNIGLTLLHIDGRKIRSDPEKEYWKDVHDVTPEHWHNFWMMIDVENYVKHNFFIVDPKDIADIPTQRRTFAMPKQGKNFKDLSGFTNGDGWKIGDVLWWKSNEVPHSSALKTDPSEFYPNITTVDIRCVCSSNENEVKSNFVY